MEENNMDKLFKNGLKNPEMPFEEADWIAMEKKLDAARAKKVRLIWMVSLSAAAAIILAFFIAIWLPSSFNKPVIDVVKKQDSVKKIISPPTPTLPSTKQETTNTHGLFVEKKSIEHLDRNTREQLDKKYGLIYRDTLLVHVQVEGSTLTMGSELNLITPYNEHTLKPVVEQPKAKTLSGQKKRSSYLTILAAPDLTTVQGAGNPQVSQNIGVLYTMPLSNKLSVSGGLLYAKKNYHSPYSFYRPKIQRNYGLTPSQVDAACDVLDIPIELNYRLYSKRATQIKVSAGVSSYFMLREQYKFSYDTSNPDQQNLRTDYEVRGQNNHLFGVANISATFEQELNNNITIGVRPFIKLPLTGIGYGQTKLESKGLAVSVGFRLGKRVK